jgi:hypothetical protein
MGDMCRMKDGINMHTILIRKLEGKMPLRRPNLDINMVL